MASGSMYRVRSRGTLMGQRVEFGVHIHQVAGTGGALELANQYAAGMLPAIKAATSVEVNWDSVHVADVASDGEESVEVPLPQPSLGTQIGECLPPQNAAVVALRSGQKSRRRRGRFFLPGLSETSVVNGRLIAPQLTEVNNLGAQLMAQFGPSGVATNYRLIVYSPPTVAPRVKPPPPVHTDTLVTPINLTATDTAVRTQRRRSLGVGR
jgi:hypothetical protein